MDIPNALENTNILTGIFSNSLLIYLSLRFSKKSLGTYKYLLVIFSSYDLILTVIHAVVKPRVYDFGTVYSLYSDRFHDNTWLCPIYVSCFTVPFALTNINFLHRYLAVKKPQRLMIFSTPRFVMLMAMYPVLVFTAWCWLAFHLDLDEDDYVRDYFNAKFNTTITGFRVMHNWKHGELNLRHCLITFGATTIMTKNFSISSYLACRTISEIRKAKTFSSNYRNLQIKILRALFAQSAVPVFFVYIPYSCAILFPFLKIDDPFELANLCMTVTSFFPAWDAIVVIVLIKDFRRVEKFTVMRAKDGLLALFCPANTTSTMAATLWMTQIPTTTVPTVVLSLH